MKPSDLKNKRRKALNLRVLVYLCPCNVSVNAPTGGMGGRSLNSAKMKKYALDLKVVECRLLQADYVLLRLALPINLPLGDIRPGQFVEVRVDGCPEVFLRRPVSVHYIDTAKGELWLLIRRIGPGTAALGRLRAGDRLNVIFPLGNGFSMPERAGARALLVGGGVGCAPLLYLGEKLLEKGCEPVFLLGAKTANLLVQNELFSRLGRVCTTTEDGSAGEQGFVTGHSILQGGGGGGGDASGPADFDIIYVCGPLPMMKAVARYARNRGIPCEVSLENKMACGLGACLCCVENTTEGHLCVCTDGPVFNIDRLLWQI